MGNKKRRGECNISNSLLSALKLDFQQSHDNSKAETVSLFRVLDPEDGFNTKGFVVTVKDTDTPGSPLCFNVFCEKVVDSVEVFNSYCEYSERVVAAAKARESA